MHSNYSTLQLGVWSSQSNYAPNFYILYCVITVRDAHIFLTHSEMVSFNPVKTLHNRY